MGKLIQNTLTSESLVNNIKYMKTALHYVFKTVIFSYLQNSDCSPPTIRSLLWLVISWVTCNKLAILHKFSNWFGNTFQSSSKTWSVSMLIWAYFYSLQDSVKTEKYVCLCLNFNPYCITWAESINLNLHPS